MTELARPVVSFLLENISKLLIEEAKFLSGVDKEARLLQSELKLIRSLLKDAEAKQDEAAVVGEWILQTKDLAYEADHVIESYAFEVGSLRRGGLANVLKRYSCILAECYKRHKVGLEIQALKTRVSGLTKNFQDYGIRTRLEKEASTSQQQQLRRTYSHIEEYDFVGLESDVEMLTQHLVNENEVTKYRAISISGMGGLGKTTIAKRIYNHPKVKRCFHGGLAWVCISQQWQKVDILRGLLIKLIPQKRDEIERWRDEEQVRQLLEVLQQRKCLIVLDDIWKTDAWEEIKHAFPARDTSSKILLTTRNKDVALHIDPVGFHHELRFLSGDESWELLQKKAFIERYSEDNTDFNKMKELGRKMAEQCVGLPLAVVVLGGILAKKHSLNEWEAVYGDVKKHLGKGKGIVGDQIQKILALSYTDLPDHLKLCFLYFGSFSEDAEIDAMTLYQLWFAEGIVSIEDNQVGETMLNMAERYLSELAERCVVNVKLAAIPKIGRFESCRLHDLMRDLCLCKAEEENFLKVINYSNGNEIVISSNKVRRIVINVNAHDVLRYVSPSKEMAKHFRMLKFVMSREYMERMVRTMNSQFSDFKMVRILLFEKRDTKYGHAFNLEVPKSVGTLIHLRYLSFKDSLYNTLPKSLANLKHLQTLDLRGNIRWVPNILWTMSELRYLYLPTVFKNKLQLDGLSKLEILENFNDINCEVKDLSKLTNLRVLTVNGCAEPDSLAIIIDFTSSSNSLQFTSFNVNLFGKESKDWSPIIRSLLLSRNIQVLSLWGPTGNLPKLDPNNCSGLVKLEFMSCEIHEDPMEALEKLPNLRELTLDAVFAKEMICHTMGFPKLKSLSLRWFTLLENWIVEAGAMPNLSTLAILEFYNSEFVLPDGLRFVKTLKELTIEGVTQRLKDRIQTSGEDFDKISHVSLVVIK